MTYAEIKKRKSEMTEDQLRETISKAVDCLKSDNVNSTLIARMTDDEILESYCIEDYEDYNQFINHMAHKYNI